MADSEFPFEGFSNAPVDKKGKVVRALDVPAYVDETDEGKVRDESQATKSSITANKTEDKSTDGAPAAKVPAPAAEGKEADKS